jgi:transcriptional regulator GlxA family with amidase domain
VFSELTANHNKGTPSAAHLRNPSFSEDLLDPSNLESVKDICLKWGFFHFGRFSSAYREVYGEKPSDTKRRATKV